MIRQASKMKLKLIFYKLISRKNINDNPSLSSEEIIFNLEYPGFR